MKFVGHHEASTLPIKQGDIVTIRKGTVCRCRGAERVAGRTYKIKVWSIGIGGEWDSLKPGHKGANADGVVHTVINPTITWVGAGGYWCDVDSNLLPEVNR
jgi:hypothetical protein